MGISVGGIFSGLDTDKIVSQLMKLEQRPWTQLQQKEADYRVRLSTYGELKGLLQSLKTAADALKDTSNLLTYKASSSDENVLQASAGSNAVPAHYAIRVQQLAQGQKLRSTAFGMEEAVGEGLLKIRVGGGTVHEIQIGAADTLEDVAAAINKSQTGVRASVVSDGEQRYLTLSTLSAGEANTVEVSVVESGTEPSSPANTDREGLSRLAYVQGTVENLIETQAPADAIITVDGITGIRSESNEVSGVIPGVTLTLLQTSETDVDVTVSSSVSEAKGAIKKVVDAYNSLKEFFEKNQGYDPESGAGGELLGDPATNLIRNKLRAFMSGRYGANRELGSLSDLGIGFNRSGRLEIHDATLSSALENKTNAVLQFLAGDGESLGWADALSEQLKTIVKENQGILSGRIEGINQSIEDIQQKMERLKDRLAKVEERYRSQFNALESLLASYDTIANYLTKQLSTLPGFGKNNS